MSILRNFIATIFRNIPYFYGKRRLGIAIGNLLTNKNSDRDSITTVKMQDGVMMQLDVRSRTEQWSYWTGDYDHELISRLSTYLKEECVVFDVGANIGFYSVSLGNRLKKLNGHLHAFEPVKNNFNRLLHNIALNDLEQIVTAHNIAIGDEEGTIEISMENSNNATTGNAVMVKGKIPANHFGSNTNVRLTKLDTLIEEQQISACHLIKIDIEGAEVMFLRGGKSFLGKNRPLIYGEFNSYFLEQFGHSFLDVVEIVKPWEYRFFKQKEKIYFTEIEDIRVGIENVLLVPSETPSSVLSQFGVIT